MYKVTMKGKTILSVLSLDFRQVVSFIEKVAPADFKKIFSYLLFGGVSFVFYDSEDKQEKKVFIIEEKNV